MHKLDLLVGLSEAIAQRIKEVDLIHSQRTNSSAKYQVIGQLLQTFGY